MLNLYCKFEEQGTACKYRELIFKIEITDFFIFCQEKPYF